MLNYDDSAFYYFFLATLLCYLIPASLISLNTIAKAVLCRGGTSDEKAQNAKSPFGKNKKKPLLTPGFVIATLLHMALWALFFYVSSILAVDSEIASFDPYTILGLDTGATERDIKKAYRKMSLEYHPDRNPGDTAAKNMFVQISKAHDALTDDEARANYEQYGNPDGRQSMEVSIGLPTFLLERDNHTMILIIYLGVLVVMIPMVVGIWWSYSQQYGENEVMQGTYQIYQYFIKDNLNIKLLPEIMASSQEFGQLQYNSEDTKEAHKHFKKLKDERKMVKPRYIKNAAKDEKSMTFYTNNVMMHAYLMRMKIPRNARKNVNLMLLKFPKLLEVMVFMTTVAGRRWWLNQTISVVQFSQYLTQGMWREDSPLLQLPHFTSKEAGHCKKGKKARGGGNMREYLRQAPEERKGMQSKNFSDKMKQEVHDACAKMSDFEVKVTATVDDEDQIATNDTVTMKVSVTRLNIKQGECAGPVYAPSYPEPKYELIWVLLARPQGRNLLMSMPQKIADQSRNVSCEFKFRAPEKPGRYEFDVHVMSDSYIGLDVVEKHAIDVISEEELPKYEMHPEDAALDDQPTIFTQIMETDFLDDTDSESDEDADETEKDDSGMTAAQRKRRRERLARKKGGDDEGKDGSKDGSDSSDSDSD